VFVLSRVKDRANQADSADGGCGPPPAAVYHGRDGLQLFVEEIDEVWESFQLDPEELIDADDQVVAATRLSGRGRESGVETDMREYSVWTLREDKVSRIAGGYGDRDEALEAAGLRE
jgi:hypothetical protein